jgi:signal transduction histidine kinase
MGEEEQRRLFGRFSRGEGTSRPLGDEGSGLGLSIVASIMRLHGGEALAKQYRRADSVVFKATPAAIFAGAA